MISTGTFLHRVSRGCFLPASYQINYPNFVFNPRSKSHHIKWQKGSRIFQTKWLKSPLFLGCIEMSFSKPLETKNPRNIQKLIETAIFSFITLIRIFYLIEIKPPKIMLVRYGNQFHETFGTTRQDVGLVHSSSAAEQRRYNGQFSE